MSEPSFLLAIDVGNSRVSAAVAHGSRESYDNPALFSLGANEHSAPSAVFVAEDEALFFGEEATRRGAAAPHRLVREFAHDVGNGVRLLIGEHAVSADDLVARLCAWVVDQVTEAEGEQPAVIAITHPTTWGGHRLSRLRGALQRAGIDAPILLSESEASARQSETALPLDPGHMLAVYDLGGTRFDARVLRQRSGGRYQPVGDQVSIERLGGASFDDELMRHVLSVQGSDVADAPLTALAEVRSAVVEAKELLSSAGDATVRLGALAGGASVRVTRSELEGMIAADLDRTVEALDLAIESADAHGDRLKGIVLAGGSSRTPLVAQRLSERFDVQIVADADTKAATALGAARIACDLTYGTGAATETLPAPSARTSRAVELKSVESKSVEPKSVERKPEENEEQDQPGEDQSDQKTRAAAFLQALFAKPSRATSPALLAVAAVFIAATIVLSNTTAAGTRWPDFVAHAASTLMSMPKPLGGAPTKPTPDPAPAAPATPQVPATESGVRPVSNLRSDADPKQATPKTRQSGPKVEPVSPSNDSGGSTGGGPTTPGSTDTGTSTAPDDQTGPTPGDQTGTAQPPADTSDPDDTGDTTTTPPPETTPTDPIPDTTPPDTDGSNPTDPTAPPADTTPPPEDPAPVSPTPVAETPLAETAPTAGDSTLVP